MEENSQTLKSVAHNKSRNKRELTKLQIALLFAALMATAVILGSLINFIFGAKPATDVFKSDSSTFKIENITFDRKTQDMEVNKGSLVIFQRSNALEGYLIKRVIATGGETVNIDDWGSILINGVRYQTNTQYYRKDVTMPVTVPDGQLFVIGDSDQSADSRSSYVGFVEAVSVEGIARE